MDKNPLEEHEQIDFVNYLEKKGIKFTAIPNNTFTTSWNQKRKNKATGLRPGLPDILMIIPCGDGKKRIAFVEMKRVSGGVVSEEQKNWILAIKECEETDVEVCRGCKDAIEFVESLLNMKK